MTLKETSQPSPEREHTRTGLSKESLKRAFKDNLFYVQARFQDVATPHDLYMAAAYTVRDRMFERWIKSAKTYQEHNARTVCYLSAEYLLGPHLGNNLINLGIMDNARQAAEEMGLDMENILAQEEEPGLGNGGLGRLAACYMDSLSTLQIPAIGYGIRYEFGIFDQEIHDGWQVEISDLWLRNGNPWEIPRPKLRYPVKFGGSVERHTEEHDRQRICWLPDIEVNGVAYDTPILGFGVDNANLLRLWHAEASQSFDFHTFHHGNYYGAVNAKIAAESITKVLYPNDEPEVGKELRLKQQYFFVSCSLQDMIRLCLKNAPGHAGLEDFHNKFTAQLNDTHPAIAVAELMRLLMDDHQMAWQSAWRITRHTFAYTNHTLLPEALECWSLELFRRLLPRHLEIIYEINHHFLDQVRMRFPWDDERINRMSLIGEEQPRTVRMANLASVGSYAVNGVAAMHSELVKSTILKDFYELWPDKFHNVTNGITPRRFVQLSNPGLNAILHELAGPEWAKDLDNLRRLEPLADDAGFQDRWRGMKLAAKECLAKRIMTATGVKVNPRSLFDIQVKRIHEYKRQHLNVLHIISLYNRIKQNPNLELHPRTFVFGGKAAPGYAMAKLIIKLINSVAEIINNDPQINEHLRVAFYPDFNVKNAEPIYPAADLSEQISTAGKEASGTGNMKFSMNGALTIGTLDGANVEIREAVGHENFFCFGLTEEQVAETSRNGYRPWDLYQDNPQLHETIALINAGVFSHGDRELFRPLTDNLIYHDPFLVLADYQSYVDRQNEVNQTFLDPSRWNRMSILNVARMGKFSSDRSIREYCEKIWKVKPVKVEVTNLNHDKVSFS
ncbi:MAG: glycogen/starch/alpha-glucan phosphorylase [Candidatus Thiodiazotropha sp. (ex Dulcina madagascariensis)]|nr:glycogen/starch/alpha-glucan phosphorylase [Candidatus Thiodiazotropha sp. (ex Dulcina madagascariensis)]